mmetsp:Transcript_58952/g.166250  ORF Transcript_58952/g.166250 Transcript_58952/m.166250 type:complete len:328 (+) Transcript_58952:125-1108(+)
MAKRRRVPPTASPAEDEAAEGPGQVDEQASQEPKKRKRKQEVEDDVTEEKKPKKAKKESNDKEAVEETEPVISEAEEHRRRMQTAIRALVLKLREEGKTEKEIKDAKKALKAKDPAPAAPEAGKNKKERTEDWYKSEEGKQERQANLQTKHDLVVIPIVWRGRHDKLDVEKVAEDIKACVAQQGVDVWLDARRHLTPGQKFAHWEYRGVMLRIEVGPDDVKAGVCRVCLAKTPGDYKSVERKRVQLPPQGTRKLLLTLKEWGLSNLEVKRRKGESEGEDEDGTQQEVAAPASVAADDVEGNWTPRAPAGKAAKQKDGGAKGKKRAAA